MTSVPCAGPLSVAPSTLGEGHQSSGFGHQAQLTGPFLIDRDGIVRRVNVECAREGLEYLAGDVE